MNVPVVVGLALLVVLAGLGWPSARLFARSGGWAAAAAPATAGLAVSLAVALCTLTRAPMAPWLGLALLGGWAWYLQARRRGTLVTADDGPDGWVLLVALVVAALPVLLVDIPPVESDARYIWWFHASWYRHGGDVTRLGMTEPSFRFSRSRYPPLLTGVIATVWHLVDAYGAETALRVSQLYTAAAVAAAGFFTTAAARLRGRGAAVFAAAITAICWGANARSASSASRTWPGPHCSSPAPCSCSRGRSTAASSGRARPSPPRPRS